MLLKSELDKGNTLHRPNGQSTSKLAVILLFNAIPTEFASLDIYREESCGSGLAEDSSKQ